MAVIDKIKSALHKDDSAHSGAPNETGSVPNLTDQVAFDDKQVTVIFVLGGPGAGKLSCQSQRVMAVG